MLIEAAVERIRGRLPASVATIEELPDGWHRVGLRAERLDWVPGVLALIDRPFVIERPDEAAGSRARARRAVGAVGGGVGRELTSRAVPATGGPAAYGLADEVIGGPAGAPESGTPA